MSSKGKYGYKTVIIIMLIAALCCLAGCGSNSAPASADAVAEAASEAEVKATVAEAEPESIEGITVEAVEENVEDIEAASAGEETAEETTAEPIDTSWYTENNQAICGGVYFVGKDLSAGNYILTCKQADWSMQVTLFESVEKYYSYFRTDRFTYGEENDAVEQNALANNFVYTDDSIALNVKDGYVVMIEGGIGSLVSASAEAAEPENSVIGSSITVLPGLYLPGDLPADTYMLTCTEAEYGMEVTLFEDREAYDGYLAEERFTVGEERNAMEKHAQSNFYIDQGETVFIPLDEKMVLTIDHGTGQLEPVEMNWGK